MRRLVTETAVNEALFYRGGERVPVDGFVWCHTHGCVHDDTTDPYRSPSDRCSRKEHRRVYWAARAGDWK